MNGGTHKVRTMSGIREYHNRMFENLLSKVLTIRIPRINFAYYPYAIVKMTKKMYEGGSLEW